MSERHDDLGRIIHALYHIEERLDKMAGELDTLTAKVARNTDVVDSAITLIVNIHDLLVAAGTDPAKLQALADTLSAEDDKLAAAIVANTSVAPAP